MRSVSKLAFIGDEASDHFHDVTKIATLYSATYNLDNIEADKIPIKSKKTRQFRIILLNFNRIWYALMI